MVMGFARRSPNDMKSDLDRLREESNKFVEEKKINENLLDLYDEKLYKPFQEGVLLPELNRLAHKRMGIQADDRYLHERIQGQYNEIERLLTQPKELQEEINLLSNKLEFLGKQMSHLEKQLAKSAKQGGKNV